MNDTILSSDNTVRFRRNILERISSATISGQFGKYKYLTGEEILPSNQRQLIEQTKFTDSPLGIAFEKQTKAIKGLENKSN